MVSCEIAAAAAAIWHEMRADTADCTRIDRQGSSTSTLSRTQESYLAANNQKTHDRGYPGTCFSHFQSSVSCLDRRTSLRGYRQARISSNIFDVQLQRLRRRRSDTSLSKIPNFLGLKHTVQATV